MTQMSSLDAAERPRAITLRMAATYEVSYPIIHPVGPVFDPDEDALAALVGDRDVLLVVDATVEELFGRQLHQYASDRLRPVGAVAIGSGEQAKSITELERICAAAFGLHLSRDGVIIGVGGGCTLDVAGLAAALYRRGVGYVRVPTTLVGMIDVSVGVKHAVNFAGGKNVLGAFYEPLGSLVDLSLLRTLPQGHISCGLSEIIKIAMVCDARLFELLEGHVERLLASRFQAPSTIASEVAVAAEQLMLAELRPNLWESCRQRLADFGHSVSPTLEADSDFRVPHGQAVAIDMVLSTALGVVRGFCDEEVLARLYSLCVRAGLATTQSGLGARGLLEALNEARRHRGGALNLVVPTGVGSATFLQDVSEQDLLTAMRLIDQHADAAPEPLRAGACL